MTDEEKVKKYDELKELCERMAFAKSPEELNDLSWQEKFVGLFQMVIKSAENNYKQDYDKLKEAIGKIKAETEAWINKTKSYTYYFGEMKAEGMQQVLDIINKHTEGLV